jgi:hypothetical protein
MRKQINGEGVLFERWARRDLDTVERREGPAPALDKPPTVAKGTKVYIVQEYAQDGEYLYNFYHRGKIYHGLQQFFSDVPPDAPPPSTSLGVKTAEK